MESARLRYRPLGQPDLDAFHALVRDEHVRRYLLDGQLLPRAWSEARARASEALFAERGVGLSLAYERTGGALVGFCGFMVVTEGQGPELVYALTERFTGRGYATEMGRTCVAQARAAGLGEIRAGVDEVNVASMRVLEKLGFQRVDVEQGAFGNLLSLRLALDHV
jgi:RimJ/RimL family protein N-acetyltransferase